MALEAGCDVVEVAPIASPFATDVSAWVSSAMTKLRVWEQTDLDKAPESSGCENALLAANMQRNE